MKLFVCLALVAAASVEGVMNKQRLRGMKATSKAAAKAYAYAHDTADLVTSKAGAPPGTGLETGNSAAQYEYANARGNGNADLSSPVYGSYGKNYGPVNQLLTSTSGYGGFPSSIDPRGFNAQTQNYTAGAIQVPRGDPGHEQPGSVARPGLFQPSILGTAPGVGGAFAAGALPGNNPFVAGGMAGAYVNGLPVAGHPFLNNGIRLAPTSGAVSGVIPVAYPNGAMRGVQNANYPNTPAGMAPLGHPAISPIANFAPIYTGNPTHGVIATPGNPYPGMASPLNPVYQSMTMLNHQATLGGSVFNSPGLFHPTAQSYPSPDADKYNSVVANPVLPPNYGKENPVAAKPAA